MKTNFQQKLVLSFLVIFTVFTVGIVVFEQRRARQYKTEALRERLDAYAEEVSGFIRLKVGYAQIDSLLMLFPANLRVTLVDRGGTVVFDNAFSDLSTMGNHSGRPEIADAIKGGSGTFIRTSSSNDTPYLYYAKDCGDALVVRVALPYDIEIRSFLKPDNAFLYFVIALFAVGFILIYYVSRHFGKSVRYLRDFSVVLKKGAERAEPPRFPKDELGEIGCRLVEDFNTIRESEKKLLDEREKLLLHIQTSAEGVCFFNPDRTAAFYNGLFLQYFNMISQDTVAAGGEILDDAVFGAVVGFLDDQGGDDYYETRIVRHGKEFMLRLNIFGDGSFEIILTDVTAGEKTRRLKQEMTGNIAHELRTPVTSIRGFLEIILGSDLPGEKSREYLERAYAQTKTLSELISDMSLLTRMDEKHDAFGFSDICLKMVIDRVYTAVSPALEEKSIVFSVELPDDLIVRGNESLLYSVFRNLTDNVVRHAGEGVLIDIKFMGTKDGTAYFSFADNGRGVADEQHLGRLFERFYRPEEGRTRDRGGSGLGLSIVKNALKLQGGTITARNRDSGGLEFLLTLTAVPPK